MMFPDRFISWLSLLGGRCNVYGIYVLNCERRRGQLYAYSYTISRFLNCVQSKIPAEWRTKALSKVDPVGESVSRTGLV